MSAARPLYSRTSFCHLPTGVSTLTVAEECRGIALAFVNGISGGWGKRELAGWLSGPYRHVTGYATAVRSANTNDERDHADRDPSKNVPSLDNATLETLLRDARWTILAALEASMAPRARGTYVGTALAQHLALPCIDDRGGHGWVPVDAPAARLHQRVLALFAVDQLRAPEVHKSELLVCPRCERVVFDELAKARGLCGDHSSASEMIVEDTPPRNTRTYAVTPNDGQRAAPVGAPGVSKMTLIGVGHGPTRAR